VSEVNTALAELLKRPPWATSTTTTTEVNSFRMLTCHGVIPHSLIS
jgi:hypothetical protein